jgi:hypothetical protein
MVEVSSEWFLKNLSDLIKSLQVPFKGLCVVVLRGCRNLIQEVGRALGAWQVLSFPRCAHTHTHTHTPVQLFLTLWT